MRGKKPSARRDLRYNDALFISTYNLFMRAQCYNKSELTPHRTGYRTCLVRRRGEHSVRVPGTQGPRKTHGGHRR